jgi:hypothetical protein
MKDGRLTFSEYEQAFFAMVQCVEEAGLTVLETPQVSADEAYYLAIWYPDRQSLDTGQPAADRCRLEDFEFVDRVWAQRDPGKYETIYATALAGLAGCVRDRGLALPEQPELDDLHRYRDAFDPVYFQCLKTVQDADRLPGWSP